MKCNKCGFENINGAEFCANCGNSLNNNTQNNFQQIVQPQNNVIYNQQSMHQISNSEIKTINKNNNKNKKKIIIILIVVALLIAGIFISKKLFTPSDDSIKNNIVIKKTDGIEIKTYISKGENQLIVSAVNKSGKIIGSGYIEVSYYDENGNEIQVYSTDNIRYNMFMNNSQIVFGFDLPTEDFSNYYIPAKTEVEVTIDDMYQERYSTLLSQYVDNFSYSHSSNNHNNNNNNSIMLTVKNNGNKSDYAPRVLSVVFYKNKRPVYSKEVNFFFDRIEPGKTKEKEIKIPIDYKKSEDSNKDILIDYDSIKIVRVLEGSL